MIKREVNKDSKKNGKNWIPFDIYKTASGSTEKGLYPMAERDLDRKMLEEYKKSQE